jgi:hypothetical protein
VVIHPLHLLPLQMVVELVVVVVEEVVEVTTENMIH